MPKGVPNKKHSAEFKKHVIETMRAEGLSYRETARQFEVNDHKRIMTWERIYLTEGADGFLIERRGSKGRPPKISTTVEEDLISENQRLRTENAYLKNLQALVLENERHQRKKRR